MLNQKKITKKQMYQILEILEVNYSKIEKIVQCADCNIVVRFSDGYRLTINTFKV